MSEQRREGPEWVWYGGRLCVDFVNTCKERYGDGRELLTDPADLDEWFEKAGIVPCRGRVDEDFLARARELREAINHGISAVVNGSAFPAASSDTINHWLARGTDRQPRLTVSGNVPVLSMEGEPEDVAGALGRISYDAAQVLGGDLRDRLRICDGIRCGGRFLDLSAGGRRRWCVMAVCGNRAKARQHRMAAQPS